MRHFTDEEKNKAIEMYFTGNSTTQEVVDLLGYPTRLDNALKSGLEKTLDIGTEISDIVSIRYQINSKPYASCMKKASSLL